jgi:PAS domain S-box-containing protein
MIAWLLGILLLGYAVAISFLYFKSKPPSRPDAKNDAPVKLDESSRPVSMLTPDGIITEINEAALQISGLERSQAVGKPFWEAQVGDQSPEAPEQMRAALAEVRNGHLMGYEIEAIGQDDEKLSFEFSLKPILDAQGKVSAILQEGREISDRKKIEQALEQSHARYRTLLEEMRVGVVITGPDNEVQFANTTVLKLLGLTEEQVFGEAPFDEGWSAVYEDGSPFPGDRHPAVIAANTKAPVYGVTIGVSRSARAEPAWLNVNSIPEINAAGELVQVLTTFADGEQRVVAATLESLAYALNLIGDAVITTNDQGQVLLINPIAENLTGATRDAAVGRGIEEILNLVDADTRERKPSPVAEVLSTGKEVPVSDRKILVSQDGTERFITDSAAPILNTDGKMLETILVFRDVTAREQAEAERARASKLDSIGLLAGGIAHDFNNMLAGITLNLSLASELVGHCPAEELLKQASKAAVEARYLTQQLLTFSKGGTPQRQALNIAPLVTKAARFALQGSTTRITYDMQPHLPSIEGDPLQLRQVVQNIVINGMQAMTSGGEMQVKARSIRIEEDSHLFLKPGPYVEISFRDQGKGIAKEHLEKIFDPYFTTKATGTGLGLSVTYSIVRAHNGTITVQSQLNAGTTFTIYLPASEKKAYESITGPIPIIGKGKGRVLVLDDNTSLLAAMTKGLQMFGYQVTAATTSKEAIDAFIQGEDEKKPYWALVFDLTLPGDIGGVETLARLRQVNSSVRAVLCSGYASNEVMADYERYGFQMRLAKPFTIHQLGQTLEQLMDMEVSNNMGVTVD